MKKGKKVSFETIEKEYCKETNSKPFPKPLIQSDINKLRLHIRNVIEWVMNNPYKYYIDTETDNFHIASKDSIRKYEEEEKRINSCTRTDPADVEYIMAI